MFLIDWVSFTSQIDSIYSIIEFLGLTKVPFDEIGGKHGYRDSLYYNGIRIFYNPGKDNMGILIDLSGTGCRAFESYGTGDFQSIFDLCIKESENYNITRLDVAYDDKEGTVPIYKVRTDTEQLNWVSRWTEWEVRNSSKGITINLGSPESDTFLRIYDKAAERGYDPEEMQWIRCELQLRRERAFEFIKMLDDENIGDLWSGVVHNYIRFVQPTSDSNKSRWPTRKYWLKLLNEALKVKLYVKPGEEYNMGNLHNYVFKQAVGAIKTSIKIMGKEKFYEEVENAKVELNPKYKRLISENKLHKERKIYE